MSEARGNQRRHSRVQLPIPAEVSWMSQAQFRHAAHLRDVSAGGAFLYAQLSPSIGAEVRVDFSVPVVGSEVHISCEGKVVRIEPER